MRYLPLGPAAAFFAALALTPAVNAQSVFSEDFDSYANGSAIEGQAGWETWWGCGTFQAVNTVTTAQSFSGPNGLRMVGGGTTCAGCSDTVNQLNGPHTAGQFTFTTQTYIPGAFFGEGYVIMLNSYDDCGATAAWSAQVHFSSSAGQVIVDNLGNNVLINGDQNIMFDQWVELRIDIDLTANTVLYKYNGVEMYSGEWSTGTDPVEISTLDLFPGSDDTTEYFMDDILLVGGITAGPIGSNYCMTNPNTTGNPSAISAIGSTAVLDNDVTLTVSDATPNAFAFFINSQTQGFVANPGGSAGNLCLGGSIGRHQQAIFNTGAGGTGSLVLDLTTIPQPNGNVAIMAGETWNWQCWHRDTAAGGAATSNFSDGISIIFN